MRNAQRGLNREERDLVALTVLAVLMVGPRHPYDVHRFVVETRKDFVTGVPRSIYHAVGRLERAHLIEPIGSEQAGGRPERTVYALTDAGRAEVRHRVSALLSVPQADRTATIAALSYLGILEQEEALVALRARIAALDAQIASVSADLAEAADVPEILLVEAEFDRAQLQSERGWFAAMTARLDGGELAWVPEQG